MAKVGSVDVEDLLDHSDWLRRLARHLVGDAAEDVAQEVWLAAHRRGPDPSRPARPWLSGVLRNISQARRRDDGRRLRREQDYQANLPHIESPLDVVYERLELQRLVAEQVLALEESLRAVVVLRYYEGLDSVRIARLIGAPEGTVRWRLKRALDRLRSALDHRHGGRREAWVAVLAGHVASGSSTTLGTVVAASVPAGLTTTGTIAMATTTTKTILSAALALAALLMLSLGLFQRWRSRTARPAADLQGGSSVSETNSRSQRPGDPRGASARPAAGGGPSGRGLLVKVSPEDLAGCRTALERTRRDAAAHDRAAREWVPSAAFEAGEKNPSLSAQLAPQISQLWTSEHRKAGLEHELECRAWSCRLTVMVPGDDSGDVGPWIKSITPVMEVRRVRNLKIGEPAGRGVVLQVMSSTPTESESSRRSLEKFVFFFGAPSGAQPGPAVDPPMRPEAVPASITDCENELSVARERLRSRQAELAGFQPMADHFAAGTPAAGLTSRVQAAATHILGEQLGLTAACRDSTCRIRLDKAPDPAKLDRLADSLQASMADAGKIQQEIAGDREVYLTVAKDGRDVLLKLLAPSRNPGFFDGCPQPDRAGKVLVRLHLPSTGRKNDQGVFGRVSVRVVSGSLASTPAGVCLAERIGGLVSGTDLPDPVGDFLRFESWRLAPDRPPEMHDD